MKREAHIVEEAVAAETAGLQQRLARLCRTLGVEVRRGAADHHPNQRLGRDVGDVMGADQLAVTQDSDAVGDAEDLGQVVGDEDDRQAIAPEAVDDLEESADLLA